MRDHRVPTSARGTPVVPRLQILSLSLGVAAILVLCRSARADNDYPPPQSIIPELRGMPPEQQSMVLGSGIDKLNEHLYATDGKQQRQFTVIAGMKTDIATLTEGFRSTQESDAKKQENQRAQLIFNLLNSAGLGGTIVYQVRQHKEKKGRDANDQD